MKYFIILLFILTIRINPQEMTGSVYGRVLDFVSKQPISFANIVVLGTNFGAASDIDGYNRIENLPTNTYQLRASVIG